MIAGHLGIAYALAARQPRRFGAGLFAALVFAAYLPDVLDVVLALLAVCSPSGLYTHTIPSVVVQAACVGGLVWLLTGSPGLTAIFAGVVLLHPLADFVTGRKLIWPGQELFGLRMYDRPLADAILEVAMVGTGWWLFTGRRGMRGAASASWPLVFAIVVQCALDVSSARQKSNVKPNSCASGPSTKATAFFPLIPLRDEQALFRRR